MSTEPDDKLHAAVDRFAARMKAKLDRAMQRGKQGWDDPCWSPEQMSEDLHEHVAKGDPIDVANYCLFLDARNWDILPAEIPDEFKGLARFYSVSSLGNIVAAQRRSIDSLQQRVRELTPQALIRASVREG